jgi:hypothetical protein
MSLTQEIDTRIKRFVAELNELVRKEALQAVSAALGTNGAPRRGPGRPPAAASSSSSAPAAKRARSRRKGEKRTQAELAQLESALASHVRANPGQGIEAIGKSIGLPTAELSRPMKKLVLRGAIRTQGAKRATKYFAGDGSAEGGSASGAASKRRKSAGRKKSAARKKSKKR